MTIFCVGRNYAAHAREMGSTPDASGEPIVFLKPGRALVRPPDPLVFPAGIGEVHHEAELVLRIGRDLEPDAPALGLDLTDRPRQAKARQAGMPWAAAKGFRGSAAVGPWVLAEHVPDLSGLRFTLQVNGVVKQRGDTSLWLHPVAGLLAYLERWFGLEPGDLVFTGTPEGVGPIVPGDVLELTLDDMPQATARFEVGPARPGSSGPG
jgi:2-keto-4-pentenoate hydratase/2-oxohepta-3-ene-1,7-dioic acid hydratase in catechol pathway